MRYHPGVALCKMYTLQKVYNLFVCFLDNDIKAAKILNMLGRSKDIEKVADTFAKRGESSSKIMDWVEIFTIKSNRKSLLITFLLGAFQQTSGVAVVLFFATIIFQLAGSTIKPDLATIIIGVTRLLSSLIAPLLVESKGRRILLLISMAACACSLVSILLCSHCYKW